MRFRKSNVILGLALVVGMFLFMYLVIDSSPHGLYGDDEAKKFELKNLEHKLKTLESDLAVNS
jgi:hypothetical protein